MSAQGQKSDLIVLVRGTLSYESAAAAIVYIFPY